MGPETEIACGFYILIIPKPHTAPTLENSVAPTWQVKPKTEPCLSPDAAWAALSGPGRQQGWHQRWPRRSHAAATLGRWEMSVTTLLPVPEPRDCKGSRL